MREGDYFSASSLETRAPAIYYEYVGKHIRTGTKAADSPNGVASAADDRESGAKTGLVEGSMAAQSKKKGSAEGKKVHVQQGARQRAGGPIVDGDGERVSDDVQPCLQVRADARVTDPHASLCAWRD